MARSVLRKVYNVELINIPQRRQKQFLELEPIVVQDEVIWLKEITSNIRLEVLKQRGILVICETIEHANRIGEMLKHKLPSNAVKLYTMNDMNQEKNVEKILPGEVIIATNLAGRGTDIQTDEIEASGGLHVILTFLPSNQRVEDQAFGRTARQGRRGTGLMILNVQSLGSYINATTNKVTKTQRDAVESSQLAEFEKNELPLIQVKDRLFDTFCKFLNEELRCGIKQKHNSYPNAVVSSFTDVMPTVYESNVLAAVEEQWAFFLHRIDDETLKCEDADNKCQELIGKLRDGLKNDALIKNPYYFTCIAYDIIVNEWSVRDKSKAEQALEYFRKAIKSEETQASTGWFQRLQTRVKEERSTNEFSESAQMQDSSKTTSDCETVFGAGAAHFGVAWCLILLKEADYKNKALKSFQDALNCLSNEMSLLNSTQILLEQKQAGFVNSDLYKQLNVKATILGSYLNGIQSCIEAIKRSMRLIDVIETKKYDEGNTVLKRIRHFYELERNEQERTAFKGKVLKLGNNESYSIIFNSLTTREDSMTPFTDGAEDQASITVTNAFRTISLPNEATKRSLRSRLKKRILGDKVCVLLDRSMYTDIRIKLRQTDLARITTLFNPDKTFEDLTRETALMKLKEDQTYMHALINTSSHCADLISTSTDEGRQIKKVLENRQINEIIKYIEDQPSSDETLRFDLVIKKVNENEINKLLRSNSGSKNRFI